MFLTKGKFLRQLSAALALTVVAAVGLWGCGGSGDPSDSSTAISTSELSKAQFVKRAEAICVQESTPILPALYKYSEAHPASSKKGDEKAFSDGLRKIIPPAIQAMADEIRKIGAPSGDEEKIEAFLAALEKDGSAIANDPAMASSEELDSKFRRSGKLASEYGIAGCAFG